jgi:hypothetical protein
MLETVVLLDEFIESAHENLQKSWLTWNKARRERNAVDLAKKSAELMQTLAQETRIWIFSMLADLHDLPKGLRTPSAMSAFGSEVRFLKELLIDHRLRALAESKPEASSGFVRLKKVSELVKAHSTNSDATAEEFEREFDRIERDSRETWLDTMDAFVPLRNLDSHRTNQEDSDGAPITITESLEQVAPLIAKAMSERIRWMMTQAAAHFGSFELRSTKNVAEDHHETVSDLRRQKKFGFNSASYWYVRYDSQRNAKELFPRLDSDKLVREAADAEETDSTIFTSAKEGCFLPLIGPAFGLPEKPNSPGAIDVLQRASAVVGDERYSPLKGFLLRLVSYRLNLDIPDFDSVPPRSCNPRDELVGELASLAYHASVALGHSLSKWGSPLPRSGEVLLEAEAAALLTRIRLVKEAVRKFSKALPEQERSDLGAYGIVEDLKELESEVSEERLSLTSVYWLDDIVWHALRWDAPLYPDSEALDLQLSLGSRRPDDRGGALLGRAPASSGTALFVDQTRFFEYLEKWSKGIEKRIHHALSDSRWQDPYKLVAKAMAICLEKRQKGAVNLEEPGHKTNVFVVDATFDQRLCTALEEERALMAVVYPIHIVDKNNTKYAAWAMRRSLPVAAGVDEYEILWDDCGRIITWQDVPRIIVLKPFGAPLEPSSQLTEATKRNRKELKDFNFPVDENRREDIAVERRYLFDDVSILRDMVRRQDSMPPGFRHAIHNDGTDFQFYFLGYAIEEYGRRARMVADVRPENDDGKEYRRTLLYLSQPPPSGLVIHYLKRAGFVDSFTSLPTAMRDLELSLEQYRREGAKP